MVKQPQEPSVSVIMPVRNCERYVEKAIRSILEQTYTNFEFIIIDDASTDTTAKIIQRLAESDKRIVFTSNQTNLGLTKNLNIALRKSRGKFIARMDGDDISLPNRFAHQVEFLDAHPEISIVGTWAQIIDGSDKVIGRLEYETKNERIRKRMIQRSQFIHPSVMFRKEIVESVGFYDESFRSAQDYEFFPRALTKHKGENIPQVLLQYRWDFTQNEGFTSGKKQERNALRARFRMLTKYGWPAWHVVFLAKPLISYLVPLSVKKIILRSLAKK